MKTLGQWIVAFMAFAPAVWGAPGTMSVRAPDSTPQLVWVLKTAALAAFADSRLPAAMRAETIPGAVCTVVQGGQAVFEKAYGVANTASRTPVSTSNTLFRVASLSKILTAASVLQLVQAHRLSLHRDVNRYLAGFHIAPAFQAPITLANLLTHSSGFDVTTLDNAARTVSQKLSLRDYLVRFQPARIRPPGSFSGYDNYGYALAGYLVQKVSGVPFPDYVQQQLLRPLEMDHTSFAPDAALRKELATGYWLDGNTLRAYRPDHVNITPAAGLCSTAADMSRWLAALLTDRRPDGARAFSPGVISGLETQQFAFNAAVPGRCYGFDEVTLDGRRVLRQTGAWPGFNSLLLLFPHQHCGMFIAYNRCDQLQLGWSFAKMLAVQFFPPPPDVPVQTWPQAGTGELAPLCGSYLSLRFPQDEPHLGVPPEATVTRTPEGQLGINGRLYREIGPRIFEQILPGGIPGRHVAFRLGREGQAADLITEDGAYRRATWSETRQGRAWLIGAASLVFLSVVVVWPIAFVVRFISAGLARHPAPAGRPRLPRLSVMARGMALAACALALWFEVSLAITEARLAPFATLYGLPAPIKSLFSLMPLFVILAATLAVIAVLAWSTRLWNFAHRLHYTLIPLALALLLYVFYRQHLLLAAYSNWKVM